MTYNIDFIHAGGSAWWYVCWIAAAIAAVVFGVLIAAKKRKHFRRLGIFRGVLVILVGVAGITTGIVFASVAHHELTLDRQHAVEHAWGLNGNDAAFLLDHAQTPPDGTGCFFGACDDTPPTTALVTLHGKPAQAYLLRQGDGLRLIVDDKPVAVSR